MEIVLFCVNHGCWKFSLAFYGWFQFVIFKLLSYCLEETKGFDVKASFARCPVSRLIGWSKKSVYITKEFWEKAIQFHGTFHGLKITNWFVQNVFFLTKVNEIKEIKTFYMQHFCRCSFGYFGESQNKEYLILRISSREIRKHQIEWFYEKLVWNVSPFSPDFPGINWSCN